MMDTASPTDGRLSQEHRPSLMIKVEPKAVALPRLSVSRGRTSVLVAITNRSKSIVGACDATSSLVRVCRFKAATTTMPRGQVETKSPTLTISLASRVIVDVVTPDDDPSFNKRIEIGPSPST